MDELEDPPIVNLSVLTGAFVVRLLNISFVVEHKSFFIVLTGSRLAPLWPILQCCQSEFCESYTSSQTIHKALPGLLDKIQLS